MEAGLLHETLLQSRSQKLLSSLGFWHAVLAVDRVFDELLNCSFPLRLQSERDFEKASEGSCRKITDYRWTNIRRY